MSMNAGAALLFNLLLSVPPAAQSATMVNPILVNPTYLMINHKLFMGKPNDSLFIWITHYAKSVPKSEEAQDTF